RRTARADGPWRVPQPTARGTSLDEQLALLGAVEPERRVMRDRRPRTKRLVLLLLRRAELQDAELHRGDELAVRIVVVLARRHEVADTEAGRFLFAHGLNR